MHSPPGHLVYRVHLVNVYWGQELKHQPAIFAMVVIQSAKKSVHFLVSFETQICAIKSIKACISGTLPWWDINHSKRFCNIFWGRMKLNFSIEMANFGFSFIIYWLLSFCFFIERNYKMGQMKDI